MPCTACGLDNKTCEEWGYPELVKHERAPFEYCSCDHCEGHLPAAEWIDLPKDEWYWKPKRRIADMTDCLRLDSGNSRVSRLLRSIDRKDDTSYGVRITHDWTTQ